MANLPIEGCVTQVSIMRDVRDPLGLHFNPKYLKSSQKRLSYCQFTNGRLRDSSEYHAGCIGSIRASFETKRSKIGKKRLSYGQFTNWRMRDLSEHHVGCTGSIRASFELKRSKIGQKSAEL